MKGLTFCRRPQPSIRAGLASPGSSFPGLLRQENWGGGLFLLSDGFAHKIQGI